MEKIHIIDLQGMSACMLGRKQEVCFHRPCSFVLLRVDHRVLDGFVDQRVHVRREGADGLRQSLTTPGQKLLSLCVQTELHLKHQPKITCSSLST